MFNAGYKKEALKAYERAGKEYKKQFDTTVESCEKLYEKKKNAVNILLDYENYINSLANKPKYIEKKKSEISVRRKEFEKEIEKINLESKKANTVSQNVAGAGALAGVGVATFGPTAAMGVATTFGTASTGTAIATLSGVAQTNAALAWLGGGALTAGGGGMAAGQALLALAGPAGWAIGGAALIGGGLLANSKNKKIAAEAEKHTKEIKAETINIQKTNSKVCAEIKAIDQLNSGVKSVLKSLRTLEYNNYKMFSDSDKDTLMMMINSAEALSKRIGVKIV
ncbi:hypothetical protein SAMN05216349_108123 [Oribacterium sp. KHPX15]|uniref:hypothetical protein n=1 Tax=Oribacterium sp. KHPX15 TaxID=1855342 RepID=UPI000895E1E1|nr:hypothetical protein [Oribacterium sp. KHPX15]SEA29206.1 hypothetical protein SAMN05216349_108123 [Oribacterium sp. KHPX15]